MDIFQTLYESNKNTIIGSNHDLITKFQKNLIKDYNLDTKILKKNDSTKHIDKKFLNPLNYHIKKSDSNFEILENKLQLNPSIIVTNGSNYVYSNINTDEVILNSLVSDNNLLAKKLEDCKDLFIDDYIINLNSIFLNSGFELTLKENCSLKTFFLHPINEENSTIYAKNFFNIKKNSELNLIEKYSNNIASNSNIINYFNLEEGSKVNHLVIQNNINEANLQFTTHTKCGQSSVFNQLIFNSSETSTRNHHYADLIGQNSSAKLHGIFFGSDNQIIDNKTNINHLNINCNSNQTYKGVLTDKSKANYLSKTYVDKIAQKTEGYQLSRGILLSNDAYFHSKPELKIFADDVKCSHGSTIGPFDDEQIFYLRSRGLNVKKAKSLLIKSFYQDLVNLFEMKEYNMDVIDDLVNSWLLKNID